MKDAKVTASIFDKKISWLLILSYTAGATAAHISTLNREWGTCRASRALSILGMCMVTVHGGGRGGGGG